MKRIRVPILILTAALFSICAADALEIAFRLVPEATFPMELTPKGTPLYNLSYGGSLTADVELFNLLAPFVEFGFHQASYAGSENTTKFLNLVSGGG
jgi:hypothetical protein